MTKRSALMLAGGVAAAVVAGNVALAVNAGLLRASEGVDGPGKLGATPVVETVTIDETGRTVSPTADSGAGGRSWDDEGRWEDRDDDEGHREDDRDEDDSDDHFDDEHEFDERDDD